MYFVITKKIGSISKNAQFGRSITIEKVISLIGRKSNYILMCVAFIPLGIPIPIPPGVSTFLAIPAIILSFELIIGVKTLTLPSFILNLEVNRNIIKKIAAICIKYLYRFEKKRSIRFSWITKSRLVVKICNISLLIFALCVATPFPISSFFCGFGGILICIGLSALDGLFVLIGLITGIIGLILTILFAIAFIYIINADYSSLLQIVTSYLQHL